MPITLDPERGALAKEAAEVAEVLEHAESENQPARRRSADDLPSSRAICGTPRRLNVPGSVDAEPRRNLSTTLRHISSGISESPPLSSNGSPGG